MISGRSSNTGSDKQSYRVESDDSDSESEILEESPCGRWLKRKEEVDQREVVGIDSAHLAMDTEEGVEVVWNEVQFSERKNFKAQEEKIQLIFENLTQLEHPNIVKFHRYWTDTHCEKPRVIFITEYMSSGSLKQFLKKTKRNVKRLPLKAWKRWCTQILSALSYLHSCTPPIIHGNLTCDTIFIQHNGLVKIGSVAPDVINFHVKTCRDNLKNIHFLAPEYDGSALTPAIDVYSFGMCALEMAALEIQGNGDSGNIVTEEHIARTIDSLDDAQQKDFISKCLCQNPEERPSARELLFHPLLFEVHSLKLLAADCLLNRTNFNDSTLDEVLRTRKQDVVLADIPRSKEPLEYRIIDVPSAEKLEKFLEDVKYGIYPLTAYSARQPPPPRYLNFSPLTADSVKSVTPDPVELETRKIVNMICSVKPSEDGNTLLMTIFVRMEDALNRKLTCQICEDDSSEALATELVHLGFINESDRDRIASMIEETLNGCFEEQGYSATTSASSDSTTESKTSSSYNHIPVPLHSSSVERCWRIQDSDGTNDAADATQLLTEVLMKKSKSMPNSPMMQEVENCERHVLVVNCNQTQQQQPILEEQQSPQETPNHQ